MHGFNAPHARPGEPNTETMTGQVTVEGDDGTPLKVTFEAAGHHRHDVTAVHRTSTARPVLTPHGVEWEVAELDAPPVAAD